MTFLKTLLSIFAPLQPTFTRDELNSQPVKTLIKRLLASSVTYYSVMAAGTIVLHKIKPAWYVRLHRYTELRSLLELGTPYPAMRHCAEVLFDVGVSAVAYKNIPWLRDMFSSPLHVACWWRGSWSALLFFNYGTTMTTTDISLDREDCVSVVKQAPASVIAACMLPSGNDIGTSLKNITLAVTGHSDLPPKRALLYEAIVLPARLLNCYVAGKTIALTKHAGLRCLLSTVWFCFDVFAIRTLIAPLVLDRVAPYEIDGVTYHLTEQEAQEQQQRLEQQQQQQHNNQNVPAAPFQNAGEERAARLLLIGLDVEQLQFVARFCNDCVGSDLTRGSVRAAAARIGRFAELLILQGGNGNTGIDETDMQRVASVYEASEKEFELHDVDEDHRECIICLETYKSGDKVATFRSCHHSMHHACISAWLSHHSQCPVCNETLMREFSSTGFEEEQQQQQQQQQQQEEREDLHARMIRALADCTVEKKYRASEWGPLQRLFYVLGKKHGVSHVRDLRAFDPQHTLGTSDADTWQLAVASLCFAHSNWDN